METLHSMFYTLTFIIIYNKNIDISGNNSHSWLPNNYRTYVCLFSISILSSSYLNPKSHLVIYMNKIQVGLTTIKHGTTTIFNSFPLLVAYDRIHLREQAPLTSSHTYRAVYLDYVIEMLSIGVEFYFDTGSFDIIKRYVNLEQLCYRSFNKANFIFYHVKLL